MKKPQAIFLPVLQLAKAVSCVGPYELQIVVETLTYSIPKAVITFSYVTRYVFALVTHGRNRERKVKVFPNNEYWKGACRCLISAEEGRPLAFCSSDCQLPFAMPVPVFPNNPYQRFGNANCKP